MDNMDPLSDIKSFLATKPTDLEFSRFFCRTLTSAWIGLYIFNAWYFWDEVNDNLTISMARRKNEAKCTFVFGESSVHENISVFDFIEAARKEHPDLVSAMIFRLHLFEE